MFAKVKRGRDEGCDTWSHDTAPIPRVNAKDERHAMIGLGPALPYLTVESRDVLASRK